MTKKFGVVWGDGLGSMIYVTSVSNLNLSCIELIGLSWVLTIILLRHCTNLGMPHHMSNMNAPQHQYHTGNLSAL